VISDTAPKIKNQLRIFIKTSEIHISMENPNFNLVRDCFLFENVDPNDLAKILERSQEKLYLLGQHVFSEGSPADSLYFVKKGTIELTKRTSGDEQHLETVFSGDFFGVMGFMINEYRTASAEAKEPTVLLEVKFNDIRNVLEKNPSSGYHFYKNLAENLAKTHCHLSQEYAELKNLKLRSNLKKPA
jgi:CRP-like cAMP-binding protein